MANGTGEQLLRLQQYYGNENKNFLNVAADIYDAVAQMPCAFDDLGQYIRDNQITRSTYDSEMDGQVGLFDLDWGGQP